MQVNAALHNLQGDVEVTKHSSDQNGTSPTWFLALDSMTWQPGITYIPADQMVLAVGQFFGFCFASQDSNLHSCQLCCKLRSCVMPWGIGRRYHASTMGGRFVWLSCLPQN